MKIANITPQNFNGFLRIDKTDRGTRTLNTNHIVTIDMSGPKGKEDTVFKMTNGDRIEVASDVHSYDECVEAAKKAEQDGFDRLG